MTKKISVCDRKKTNKGSVYNGECAKVYVNTTSRKHGEKTEYGLHVWKRFFLEVGEARKIEEIPADEPNILICQFLIEIKKKVRGTYEPATLQSF